MDDDTDDDLEDTATDREGGHDRGGGAASMPGTSVGLGHALSRRAVRRAPAGRGRLAALAAFRDRYDFGLDDFQVEPARRSRPGTACWSPRRPGPARPSSASSPCTWRSREGRKCFYTTPIKALSNQKYADLVARYGADKVGLLTGDNSVNGEAPMVVMTTEVLRNMLYAGSPTLTGLGYVVMDEVHYLADRFRGASGKR